MTSSANAFPETLGNEGYSLPVKSGVTVYAGDLVAVNGPDAAADNGKLDKWAAAVGQILLGNAVEQATGVSAGTVRARVDFTPALVKRDVTGASAVTDRGKLVYATDENTYTLTPNTNRPTPIGVVIDWLSGTTCVVLDLGLVARLGIDLAGGIEQVIHLGGFPCDAFADGAMATDVPLVGHGEIVSLFSVIRKAPAGASGTVTVKAQLKPVGGSYADVGAPTSFVPAATGDALGAVKASSAISAANAFSAGALLKLVASATTSMSAGHVDIYAKVRRKAGI